MLESTFTSRSRSMLPKRRTPRRCFHTARRTDHMVDTWRSFHACRDGFVGAPVRPAGSGPHRV